MESINDFNTGDWGVKVDGKDIGLRFPNQRAARSYLVKYAANSPLTGFAAYKGLSTFWVRPEPENTVIAMHDEILEMDMYVREFDELLTPIEFTNDARQAIPFTEEEAAIVLEALGMEEYFAVTIASEEGVRRSA